MRLPLEWLREYVDPGLATDALAEALIQSGTIVEDVHELRVSAADGNLDNFRVGKVISAESTPMPIACGSARSISVRALFARSFAARRTWRPGRPSGSRFPEPFFPGRNRWVPPPCGELRAAG